MSLVRRGVRGVGYRENDVYGIPRIASTGYPLSWSTGGTTVMMDPPICGRRGRGSRLLPERPCFLGWSHQTRRLRSLIQRTQMEGGALTPVLCHGEAAPDLTVEQPAEIFRLLRLRPESRNHLCTHASVLIVRRLPRTSDSPMFPVSGAAQLVACGAITGECPMISAMTAYYHPISH